MNAWLGGISAIVTVLAFAIPDTRSWLATHGLSGWIAFAGVLAIALYLDGVRSVRREESDCEVSRLSGELEGERSRTSGLAAELESARAELEAARAANDRREKAKDLKLLDDLLGEMQPGSTFYKHLTDYVDFKHLPRWFAEFLSEQCDKWVTEPRQATNARLADTWSTMVQCAAHFHEKIHQNMWPLGDGVTPPSDPEWLSIPREWDYKKRDAARAELEQAHDEYLDALDALLALMHELR
ncbi:hypothetical protein [Rhodococcus pyridinivorans]|uniref:hypothetical protein n=1 Tax=Rhodococcus pyridinivorans TaxID=103816 RepID=UPI00110D3C06|nr:hypothetical protein [Rhodococcus pyridinivorans]